MRINKATINDIDLLIKLRLDFLKEENPGITKEQEVAIIAQLEDYLIKHIDMGSFIGLIGSMNSEIVSTVFLVIHEMPANPSNINGKTGTILNVYTYPIYRKKGYAHELMRIIIEQAKEEGLSSLNLSATAMGKSLYENLGFDDIPYSAMRLNL